MPAVPALHPLRAPHAPPVVQACQYIMNFHEANGDKILIFSDDIFALVTYAKALARPFVYGATPLKDRMRILSDFRHSSDHNTVFISKIGDQVPFLPSAPPGGIQPYFLPCALLVSVGGWGKAGGHQTKRQNLVGLLWPLCITLQPVTQDFFPSVEPPTGLRGSGVLPQVTPDQPPGGGVGRFQVCMCCAT